jgi:hypothetical protein
MFVLGNISKLVQFKWSRVRSLPMKKLAKDNHTSLFCPAVGDGKKFYTTDARKASATARSRGASKTRTTFS